MIIFYNFYIMKVNHNLNKINKIKKMKIKMKNYKKIKLNN